MRSPRNGTHVAPPSETSTLGRGGDQVRQRRPSSSRTAAHHISLDVVENRATGASIGDRVNYLAIRTDVEGHDNPRLFGEGPDRLHESL